MNQPFRLSQGGAIDRDQPLDFRFDGRHYQGCQGDTLASALLANGVRLVGRSFKYHRPRGVYSAGPEEPSALVTLRSGARREPNTRATVAELFDGLEAESQSRWPDLKHDLGAVNAWFGPLFVAGFYYKTFMWPGVKGWKFYERFIRKAAGLGRAGFEPDPDRYERIEAFCDVLVVGAGPAGLAAALAAGRAGARVLLVDENPSPGGGIALGRTPLEPEPIRDWTARTERELRALDEVRILTRTTAFGYYDADVLGLVERAADHRPTPPGHTPRQRHWTVRARRVVLATGAIERPLVFAGNDRPGVMLAGAARSYINRYAVLPGRRAVVFTNNDSGYLAALDLARAGAAVILADPRPTTPARFAVPCQQAGVELRPGTVIGAVRGGQAVQGAVLRAWRSGSAAGGSSHVSCDLVLSSGGWSPAVHLHSQAGGKPVYDAGIQGFVPGEPRPTTHWRAAGACTGEWRLRDCLRQGHEAGREAAADCGFDASAPPPPALDEPDQTPPLALWSIPGHGKRFVDLQNDVTTADVALAAREGYDSVELLKRYTTLGMGTDQGKTGNINGLALLALERCLPIDAVGTTTFRPPYTPVAIGAIAGHSVRRHFAPVRHTPLHALHEQAGALFTDAGHWKRALCYPRAGESRREAAIREAAHVRGAVGLVEVSTLGKIDVQGPDAAAFLDRVYVNGWRKLAVGKARYGVMLREDGIAFDDGTVTRLAGTRYFMTTTTANAAAVLRHLEYLLQVVWPELRVSVTDVTDQWAGVALAGPRSREVLATLVEADVGDTALPFMGLLEIPIDGVPACVIRISFSGEQAYEIYVPADYGAALWQQLLAAGRAHDLQPYGLDALDILRIEKGHVTGAEIDGRRTLHDLGLGAMARMNKDFVGRALMHREGFDDPARIRLVGLQSVETGEPLKAGMHLVLDAEPREPADSLGHVSSACYSPALGREIGLGFVRGGHERIGETLYATDPLAGRHFAVTVVSPHFFDPEGERLRG